MVAAASDGALSALAEGAIERGGGYLLAHIDDDDYPALWRGKSLFTPHNIVRASVLGAAYRWTTEFAQHDGV
jgi:hypothetical protein